MQMLGTWLVAFQAIRLDGGRCFKGVHLSQVHQPRKALRNRNKKAAGHVVMSSGYTLIYKEGSSRGCTCLKCTNKARVTSILLGWCT